MIESAAEKTVSWILENISDDKRSTLNESNELVIRMKVLFLYTSLICTLVLISWLTDSWGKVIAATLFQFTVRHLSGGGLLSADACYVMIISSVIGAMYF